MQFVRTPRYGHPIAGLSRTKAQLATSQQRDKRLLNVRLHQQLSGPRPDSSAATWPLRVSRQDSRHSAYSTFSAQSLVEQDKAAYWVRVLEDGYRVKPGSLPTIWARLRRSGDEVPMQGDAANKIWKILCMDRRLHDDLFTYALEVKSKSGIIFDKLYEFIIGRCMQFASRTEESHAEAILSWHGRFLNLYFIRPGAINALVDVAKASRSNLYIFRSLYRRSSCLPRQGIYDELVPELCKLHEWTLALEWHFFLYSQRDYAQSSNFLRQEFHKRPTVEEAFAEFVSTQFGIEHLKDADDEPNQPSTQRKTESEVFNPASLLHIGDDAFKAAIAQMDEKPRHAPLSDEFCARLLATKGTSVSSVIHYLQMFDHGKLGPLALRELMARSESLQDASDNLQAFQEADILPGASVYPQIVRHFLESGQFDLLQNLIQSDLHPETLHDIKLQHQLLRHYHKKQDQMSTRRTIEILRVIDPTHSATSAASTKEIQFLSSNDVADEKESLKQKFFGICEHGEMPTVQTMLDDRLAQGLAIKHKEVKTFMKHYLRHEDLRNPEKNSIMKDDLTFASNVLLRVMKTRQSIPTPFLKWVLGMSGNKGQLSQVLKVFSFVVGQYYGRPRISQKSNQLGAADFRASHPWDELRTHLAPADTNNFASIHDLQTSAANVVEWGFRLALPQLASTKSFHGDPSAVFFMGLRFLSNISEQGFPINRTTVAAAISKRLMILEGSGTSRRRRNQFSQLANYFTLEEILVSIEQIWIGERLFPEIYNEPGVPVDRALSAVPKYYCYYQDMKGKTPLYTSPTPASGAEDQRWPRSDRIDAWTYHRFDELCARHGGSILDGLINVTVPSRTPLLPRHERIQRRIYLRYFFLGTSPPVDYQATQEEWDDHIRRTAISADNSLIHAGLCQSA